MFNDVLCHSSYVPWPSTNTIESGFVQEAVQMFSLSNVLYSTYSKKYNSQTLHHNFEEVSFVLVIFSQCITNPGTGTRFSKNAQKRMHKPKHHITPKSRYDGFCCHCFIPPSRKPLLGGWGDGWFFELTKCAYHYSHGGFEALVKLHYRGSCTKSGLLSLSLWHRKDFVFRW